MGGFTLGQADLLRRAMGKKKEKILVAQRKNFLAGTQKNHIPDDIANKVFDLMVYFAGYGFNKSHSAAYAYIAWQTAYLKAHFRPEFMAATMTSVINDISKISYYIQECKRMACLFCLLMSMPVSICFLYRERASVLACPASRA